MRFLLLLAVLAVPVVAVVALLAALRQAARPGPGADLDGRLDGRRRWSRPAGLVLGLVAAALVVQTDALGRGLLLAAPVAALGLLLGVLGAELSVRPPSGPRRTASLGTRRATDYLPRRLGPVVAGTGVALLVVTATTTALASPDDLGRAGRRLTAACSAVEQSSRGPFPGSFYTVPLLVLVAVGLVLALLVLRATVARPPLHEAAGTRPGAGAGTGGDAVLAADLELRAQAGRAVVAGLGVLFALPLAGVSGVAAQALAGQSTTGCGPAWWGVLAVVLLVVALAAVGVLAWCAAVTLLGRHQPAALDVRGYAG